MSSFPVLRAFSNILSVFLAIVLLFLFGTTTQNATFYSSFEFKLPMLSKTHLLCWQRPLNLDYQPSQMPSNLFLRCLPQKKESCSTDLLRLTSWSALPWKFGCMVPGPKCCSVKWSHVFPCRFVKLCSLVQVVLALAERMCWLAVVGFICLRCMLFIGSFSPIVFCCSAGF